MSTLHVACAARRDYVPHAAAMLHSLLARHRDLPVQVHFLHGPELPEAHVERLTEMVSREGGSISFVRIDDERVAGLATVELKRSPGRPVLPASHWYRVFLPELLPAVDKLLYLDGDIIVVDSLEELWGTDLADHYLAAVTNVSEPWFLHKVAALGLEDPRDYFNSGVLLMNLDQMRRDASTSAVLEYAQANEAKLFWPEQDALNAVLGPRRLPLHPRWNCMNGVLHFPWSYYVFGLEAVDEARARPAIRHFEGPSVNKPWHYLCDGQSRALYAGHRRETPWPRYRLEGRTPHNVSTRALRGLRRRIVSI